VSGPENPRRRGRRTSSPPRVCIVRQTDMHEPSVRREAAALVEAGFAVEVLNMRHPDRPARTVIDGVELTSLPAALGRSSRNRYLLDYAWFFTLAATTLAARHVRRPYTAVQVNTMPDFLVFAAAIPKLLGSAVFVQMNEPTPELAETVFGPGRTTRVLARIEQRALAFAHHAFTVTDELRRRYIERGADGARISVVLNGTDPRVRLGTWRPSPNGAPRPFTLICHGAIEDRYGQDTIVEAARLLRDAGRDVRVVLTGRGSAVDDVVRRIDEHGLHDVVTFKGWVTEEELNDLLHAADAGIVAQKASPYSHLVHTNKMVDYWIFGLPVVASRLRATAALYDDSVIEYFAPGDAADLARAIARVQDDRGRRDELARNGRAAHARHGWDAQRPAYLAPFLALTGAGGTARPSEATSSTRPSAAAGPSISQPPAPPAMLDDARRRHQAATSRGSAAHTVASDAKRATKRS
jgi:glycosyltransferase involved in cell wall biosynthesis